MRRHIFLMVRVSSRDAAANCPRLVNTKFSRSVFRFRTWAGLFLRQQESSGKVTRTHEAEFGSRDFGCGHEKPNCSETILSGVPADSDGLGLDLSDHPQIGTLNRTAEVRSEESQSLMVRCVG